MTAEDQDSLKFLLRIKQMLQNNIAEIDEALAKFTRICKKCEHGPEGNFHMTVEACSKSGGNGFQCKAPQDHHEFVPMYAPESLGENNET